MQELMSDLSSLAAYIELAPPKWMFLALCAALVLIVMTAGRRQERNLEKRFEVRICPRCGANEPPHAMFCGTCGTRI